MLKYLNILVLFVIVSCDVKKKSNDNFTHTWDLNEKAKIVSDFKTFDAAHLSPFDSCMTLKCLRDDYNVLDQSEFRVLNGIRFFSTRVSYTDFSFSIIQTEMEGRGPQFYYYGLSDIYSLKFNEQLERGKVQRFTNKGLAQLINNLGIVNTTLSKAENMRKLKKLLFHIYHDVRDGSSESMLEKSSVAILLDEYGDKMDKELLAEEFSDLSTDDFVVFEVEALGSLVFKFSFSGNRFDVEEFIVPGKTKIQFFSKSDVLPDELWISCRTCSNQVGR